jgi:hypothetical protein
MPRVEVERSTKINVSITCESCGHQYQREAVIGAEQTPIVDDLTGATPKTKLQKKLNQLYSNDFSVLPCLKCPECGYVQSWNTIGCKRDVSENIATFAAVGIGIVIFIAFLTSKTNFFAALLLSLLIAGVLMFIFKPIVFLIVKAVYDPNRGKETAAKSIYPKFS